MFFFFAKKTLPDLVIILYSFKIIPTTSSTSNHSRRLIELWMIPVLRYTYSQYSTFVALKRKWDDNDGLQQALKKTYRIPTLKSIYSPKWDLFELILIIIKLRRIELIYCSASYSFSCLSLPRFVFEFFRVFVSIFFHLSLGFGISSSSDHSFVLHFFVVLLSFDSSEDQMVLNETIRKTARRARTSQFTTKL